MINTHHKYTKRALVHGVGINDADYVIRPTVDGKRVWCPYYSTWTRMLERCYSPKWHVKHPTYVGCTLDPVWLSFMSFKAWMITQDWKGKELDKDIIEPGNKHYCPEKCVFVSKRVNLLLNSNTTRRGKYRIGVTRIQKTGKFMAKCGDGEKPKHLGTYDTEEEASIAYIEYKSQLITDIANEQTDPRIKAGLLLHAQLLIETNQ